MMKTYEFSLRFDVAGCDLEPGQIDDRLFEAGCDDALVRHSRKAEVLIEFGREATNALQALNVAKKQVLDSLPGARFLEAKPDFVGPTDIAQVYGISRQRVQVMVQTKLERVHAFTSVGNTQVFRLASVIDELAKQGKHHVDEAVRESAFAAMQINCENEFANCPQI